MRDLAHLADTLVDNELDGCFLDADSTNSDQRYLSGFDAPDPFFTLFTPESLVLLVSELEYNRAKSTSNADTVRRFSDYDYARLRAENGRIDARYRLVSTFITDFGVDSLLVPQRFPLGTADALRHADIRVVTDRADTITAIRARKTPDELDYIRSAQAANEAAMAAAESLIATAPIDDDVLHVDGTPLTAERVKEEIEITLLRHGCGLDETIVAGGSRGADPHDRGSGPLPAHEPIVIDIFPRNKTSKYHADMTRTFVRGEPNEQVIDRFETTKDAFEAALSTVEPGVTGEAIHNAACDVYEAAGYATLRSTPETETGFIHNTGHGVGLDVHELPHLNSTGSVLEPGHVITIEPGLYDPAIGGIRLEDLVVVTKDGYDNLTDYDKHLRPTTRDTRTDSPRTGN